MDYFMGIDMGGTMVKAAIFDQKGNELVTSGIRLNVIYPEHGMIERNIFEAGEAVYKVIKESLKKSKIEKNLVKGIGVTGQANGLYMLDEFGNPVYNAVLSSDSRAKYYVEKWREEGIWKVLLPKIRQQFWPGNLPALIAWFHDNKPNILSKAKFILTAKDYVRYLLTGKFAIEITEASGWASMDQTKGKITEEIYETLGIEKYLEKIPDKILECTEILGGVTEDCAMLTGLMKGTPVIGGQMDTGASIISAGVIDEDQLGIIVGTWGINSIIKNEPIVDEDIFMVYKYCIPDMYCIMEGSSTSASNLEWFINNYMEGVDIKEVYQECNKLVRETNYKNSLFFLPFLYGSNVGIYAKSAFLGLEAQHSKAEMLRAIYEGVVFCHKYHIERLKKHVKTIKTIRMAGGAARSDIWMQMFSDILDLPVETSRSTELGAMGVAMLSAIGTGYYNNIQDAVKEWVKIKSVYLPDKEKVDYYKRKYLIYKKIISNMTDIWKDIDQLS